MKAINRFPRLPQQKDTVSIWHFVRIISAIAFIFGLTPWLLFAYYPSFQEWLDRTFDRSDQMRTGIVLLLLFSISFAVLCFVAKRLKI